MRPRPERTGLDQGAGVLARARRPPLAASVVGEGRGEPLRLPGPGLQAQAEYTLRGEPPATRRPLVPGTATA